MQWRWTNRPTNKGWTWVSSRNSLPTRRARPSRGDNHIYRLISSFRLIEIGVLDHILLTCKMEMNSLPTQRHSAIALCNMALHANAECRKKIAMKRVWLPFNKVLNWIRSPNGYFSLLQDQMTQPGTMPAWRSVYYPVWRWVSPRKVIAVLSQGEQRRHLRNCLCLFGGIPMWDHGVVGPNKTINSCGLKFIKVDPTDQKSTEYSKITGSRNYPRNFFLRQLLIRATQPETSLLRLIQIFLIKLLTRFNPKLTWSF